MRAIEVSGYGEPDVLELVQRPEPAPVAGRVRVRQIATTVNPVDLWTRAGVMTAATPGLEPPFVLGFDILGTVMDDGEGFTAGQVVAGQYPWLVEQGAQGTEADVVVADPAWLAPVPDGLDHVVAATLPLNALTALQAVDLLGVGAGGIVLVSGASGAVGGFAVQFAASRGVRVIAVASAGDEEHVASLGASPVLTRAEPEELVRQVLEIAPGGVDAALDAALIGQPLLAAVRDGGTFVTVLAPAAPPAERGITVTAVGAKPDAAQLADVLDQAATGRLVSRVAGTLPLEEAAEAHRRTARGGQRGKYVLTF